MLIIDDRLIMTDDDGYLAIDDWWLIVGYDGGWWQMAYVDGLGMMLEYVRW